MSEQELTRGSGWDFRGRIPPKHSPPSHSPTSSRRSSMSDAAHGDARLAKIQRAIVEHEKRDSRSEQARREQSFFSSLKTMARDVGRAAGDEREQLLAIAWDWFLHHRPSPTGPPPDATALPAPRETVRGPSAQTREHPTSHQNHLQADAMDDPSVSRTAEEVLQSSKAYLPFDVQDELKDYKRRDLYASFARREGLSVSSVVPQTSRVPPSSRLVVEAPVTAFAHYKADHEIEVTMDKAWAERRAAEAKAREEDKSMEHAIQRWTASRASVDEELLRRRSTRISVRRMARDASDSGTSGDEGAPGGGTEPGATRPRTRAVASSLDGATAQPKTAQQYFRESSAARTAFVYPAREKDSKASKKTDAPPYWRPVSAPSPRRIMQIKVCCSGPMETRACRGRSRCNATRISAGVPGNQGCFAKARGAPRDGEAGEACADACAGTAPCGLTRALPCPLFTAQSAGSARRPARGGVPVSVALDAPSRS